MTLSTDVQESLTTANNAYHLFGLSLQVFQAESGRGDFASAEAEREVMHAHLDSYVDNFMAANKRIQQENCVMKENDVEALVRAAAELLRALDDEDIAVDMNRSKGTLGFIRHTMNDLMIALFAFDDLLGDEEPQAVAEAPKLN